MVRRVTGRVQRPERAVARRDQLTVVERRPGDFVLRILLRKRELGDPEIGPALRERFDAVDVVVMEVRDQDLRQRRAGLLGVERLGHAIDEGVRRLWRVDQRRMSAREQIGVGAAAGHRARVGAGDGDDSHVSGSWPKGKPSASRRYAGATARIAFARASAEPGDSRRPRSGSISSSSISLGPSGVGTTSTRA